MESRTQKLTEAMIETLETELGEDVEVVGFQIQEYVEGDPTNPDSPVTGAEIELKAFASFDSSDDTDASEFRVK